MGEIQCQICQVQQGRFYPDVLEKGLRSKGALTLALGRDVCAGFLDTKSSSDNSAFVQYGCEQQDAGQHVPCKQLRAEVAADLRAIFNAPDWVHAEAYLKQDCDQVFR
ncbi:MAG: hypothetical protein GX142_10165 [Chloroflexi bacterium]|jgi:hypothetical protein|nr:hypothetical protein [Chloroflexota bacterium]